MIIGTPHRRALLVGGAALVPILAAAPAQAAGGVLRPELAGLHRLIGTWRGDADGEAGLGTVERSYEVALGGQAILARNRSTYPPQPRNPKGEVHEDIGLITFDKTRKRAVYRQFHSEGFVNQYANAGALDGPAVVFETEAIENIPVGWRARETWRFPGDGAFEEAFDLAEPGKDFAPYTHGRFRRVASP